MNRVSQWAVLVSLGSCDGAGCVAVRLGEEPWKKRWGVSHDVSVKKTEFFRCAKETTFYQENRMLLRLKIVFASSSVSKANLVSKTNLGEKFKCSRSAKLTWVKNPHWRNRSSVPCEIPE